MKYPIRYQVGHGPTEKTEIRIAYTPKTLYVAVICYDSAPEKIVVSDSRRDSNLNDDDSFLFIVDTYNDEQNGFLFGTNADGMEYDAQIDNEGQGNFSNSRQQGGAVGGTNINWDAAWEVKTKKGDLIGFRKLVFCNFNCSEIRQFSRVLVCLV